MYAAFTSSISAEIAVLKRSASMSSVTFAIAWCSARSCSRVGSTSATADPPFAAPPSPRVASSSRSSTIAPQISRQARFRKRNVPSTPRVFHGFTCSSGPMNIS